jgi:hypothetical protein
MVTSEQLSNQSNSEQQLARTEAHPAITPHGGIPLPRGVVGVISPESTGNSVREQQDQEEARDQVLTEDQLRSLFPYDHEYVRDSGLLDIFYCDKSKGLNGLLHTLVGVTISDGYGGVKVEGFHHGPSAEALAPISPWERNRYGDAVPMTRVTTQEEIPNPDAAQSKKYQHNRFEPENARVKVAGYDKVTLDTDPVTGERTLIRPVKNSMYPSDYNTLAVLLTIKAAYDGRDESADKVSRSAGLGDVLVNDAQVQLIDGKSTMKIRLVMDPTTKKIHTAIPVVKPVMNLSEDGVERVLTGDNPVYEDHLRTIVEDNPDGIRTVGSSVVVWQQSKQK